MHNRDAETYKKKCWINFNMSSIHCGHVIGMFKHFWKQISKNLTNYSVQLESRACVCAPQAKVNSAKVISRSWMDTTWISWEFQSSSMTSKVRCTSKCKRSFHVVIHSETEVDPWGPEIFKLSQEKQWWELKSKLRQELEIMKKKHWWWEHTP